MHADEIEIDAELAARLVAEQFPRWTELPIRPLASSGTVHALYRLGDEMLLRLPRLAAYAGEVEREHAWLPRLAPHLPVAVPIPLGRGAPSPIYPCPWSVYGWLEGENPRPGQLADAEGLARDLAAFILALQGVGAEGAPASARGRRPLALLDAPVRAALARSHGLIDAVAATAAWEAALRAPAWRGPALWVHADLLPGNLLVRDDRLSAVIDFGTLGLGDPASDLSVAWSLLPGGARRVFREALAADGATWARARGLALAIALLALPYYQRSNPAFAEVARYAVGEVLADHRSEMG